MPSQFQLRDLINHAIIGATIVLLSLLLLFLFFPHGLAVLVFRFQSIKNLLGDVVLLPTLLVVVYVVGAIMPSTRSLHLFGEPQDLLHRVLKRFLVAPKIRKKESSQDLAIDQLFLKKAEQQFQVHKGKSDEEWERALFVLASASVLKEGTSLQQVDIERHFILMHFNSKLCMLFVLAFLAALVGIALSLLSMVTPLPWTGIQARYLAFFGAVFWLIARASGTKSNQNHEHWRNLIIRSFVVSTPPQESAHNAAEAWSRTARM
jgi:hypothetical protein